MARLNLGMLGRYQANLDTKPVTGFESDKVRALLAYLAVELDRPHRREKLAGLFWPEKPERQARHNLSQAIYNLRGVLNDQDAPKPFLNVRRDTLQFNTASDHWSDVTSFSSLIEACRRHHHDEILACGPCLERLGQAADLYQGNFLSGTYLDSSTAFEEWVLVTRERLHRMALQTFRWLAEGFEARGNLQKALSYTWQQLEIDRLWEPAHRQAMRLLALSGQRSAALLQYETCYRLLKEELGIAPDTETIALYERLLSRAGEPRFDRSGENASFKPRHHNNLPMSMIPFVGRSTEMAALEAHISDPDCRLLTLTGPGGSGKSRLAIEIARKHLIEFPDGVYFVRLAACESVTEIVPMIAKELGLTFIKFKGSGIQSESVQNVPAKQQLLSYLHDKTMLIILDNFEHLLGGVDLLINILEAAPHILILVTSRVRLNAFHEYVCPIPGFDLPGEYPFQNPARSNDELAKYGAVRFFEQCARMTAPQFQLSAKNQTHVLYICRAVHGMPLGILLATTWLELLDPQEICTEIDQNFDFLETTLYGLPERQRSLRAVFNHTWRLLSNKEQRILQGLAVFRGSFSRQSASFITGASLSDLKTLTSKWLVERDQQGRFIIHELLRQYLAERLAEDTGEKEKIRDKHLAYFISFIREKSMDLEGNEPKNALANISLEIENLRAAWSWALTRRNLTAIQQALEGLANFYILSARYQEGENVFSLASEILTTIRNTEDWDDQYRLLLGKILVRKGILLGKQGLGEQTRETLRKGLELLQDTGDSKEQAFALLYLADWLASTEEQLRLLNKALAIFSELNERKGIAYVHTRMGNIAFSQGNFHKARQFYIESLDIHRQLTNQHDIAFALGDIGYMHWIMGDNQEALWHSQGMLETMEKLSDKEGIAIAYSLMAIVFASLKDYIKCKELIWKTFHISKETGNLNGIALSLTDIAECELMEGNDEEAKRLAKESYPYYKEMEAGLTNADWFFRILGEAECGLGNLKEGKFHLRQALNIHVKQNKLAEATHTLIGIARYLERIGQIARAFELLGLVMFHPGSWQWVRDRAASLVEKFRQKYPLEGVNLALDRGRSLDLEETVLALLDELVQDDNVLPLI